MLRCLLTGFALLTAPHLASAGPIAWSMRGDIDHSRYGSELYLGAYQRPVGNGESLEVVHAYGRMPEGLLPVGTGSQTGIDLGVQSKQGYRFDTAAPTDTRGTVTYNVWVTDAASGETGHLSFELAGFLLTGLPTTDSSEYVFGGEGGGTLILGGNRYDVTLRTGDSDSAARVYADLEVAPVAATPEPGTLALAALGLCGAGLGRRLRRA